MRICAQPKFMVNRPGRQRGFSLPEVLVAFSLVLLGAAAMMTTAVTTRAKSIDNAQFLSASRLAAELSDWSRQGGLKVFTDRMINPFDDIDTDDTLRRCFSEICNAEQAARFYLHQWRQRLAGAVRDVRLVVCSQSVPASAADEGWSCEDNHGDKKARVLKIGWPAQGDPRARLPRLASPLG